MYGSDSGDDRGVVGMSLMRLSVNPGRVLAEASLVSLAGFSIICSKKTPQAYPVVRRRDAQTGGLLFSGVSFFRAGGESQ